METNTSVHGSDLHAWSDARAQPSLAELSDAELLAGTRRLVGRSNELLAELLRHLVEVETRGVHRTRACSSLYTYCIYELRFSEDEAFRRVAAARLVRRFPALLEALASGELHLTGLLMLGPHLTEANRVEVLARAKHRTKRELARLVRILDPLPAVPARIEPLGPAPARLVPAEPTWQEFTDSTCPVRELAPGDRPREWAESANDAPPAPAEQERQRTDGGASASASADGLDHCEERTRVAAPARAERTPLDGLEPERYKVQFTATEEYVRLVDEAKSLLSHAVPNVTLEELQMRAMRALVAELKKKKHATRESSHARASTPETADVGGLSSRGSIATSPAASRARRESTDALDQDVQRTDALDQDVQRTDALDQPIAHLRRRVRHIPAAVRHAVFERDGNRCSYVDSTGTRCLESHRLEFHHLKPFAAGGAHHTSNLTLRCAAHNALAAEEDFGRELIERRRTSRRHEPFRLSRG